MLRIALCDDERSELDRLKKLIEDFFAKRGEPFAVSAFSSGQDLLAGLDAGYDVIFLDVYIGLDNGMDVARRIRERDRSCAIIFATNSKAHAVRGYGVQALQYLIKPVTASALSEALELALEELSSRVKRAVQLQNRQGAFRVTLDDLVFAESSARILTVHTRAQGELTCYQKLDDLEGSCPESRFFRCHKSYLVNLDYVQAVANGKFLLADGREIPISVSLAKAKEAFAINLAGLGRPSDIARGEPL